MRTLLRLVSTVVLALLTLLGVAGAASAQPKLADLSLFPAQGEIYQLQNIPLTSSCRN